MIIPETAVPAKDPVLLREVMIDAKTDLFIVIERTGDRIEVVYNTRTLRQRIQLENLQRDR